MDISEVAKASGLAASTLRYYEEKGLIQSIGRKGLRRIFDQRVVDRLALITLGRAAGFTLDEIQNMFTKDDSAIDRQLLLDKAFEIDSKIEELKAMRDGLRHAAACQAPSHFECPKFLRYMKMANKKKFKITKVKI